MQARDAEICARRMSDEKVPPIPIHGFEGITLNVMRTPIVSREKVARPCVDAHGT
jgi:hypothetical protein